ncbi:hypothetical protein SCALM49S_01573 [Streptomyces californicus]
MGQRPWGFTAEGASPALFSSPAAPQPVVSRASAATADTAVRVAAGTRWGRRTARFLVSSTAAAVSHPKRTIAHKADFAPPDGAGDGIGGHRRRPRVSAGTGSGRAA